MSLVGEPSPERDALLERHHGSWESEADLISYCAEPTSKARTVRHLLVACTCLWCVPSCVHLTARALGPCLCTPQQALRAAANPTSPNLENQPSPRQLNPEGRHEPAYWGRQGAKTTDAPRMRPSAPANGPLVWLTLEAPPLEDCGYFVSHIVCACCSGWDLSLWAASSQ